MEIKPKSRFKFPIYLVLVVAMLVVGFLIYLPFYEYTSRQFHFQVYSATVGKQFWKTLLFSIVLALVPLLFYVMQQVGKLRNFGQRLLGILIMLATGILGWEIRVIQLNHIVSEKLSFMGTVPGVEMSLPDTNLNLELFMAAGFILSALIFALVLRIINSRNIRKEQLQNRNS